MLPNLGADLPTHLLLLNLTDGLLELSVVLLIGLLLFGLFSDHLPQIDPIELLFFQHEIQILAADTVLLQYVPVLQLSVAMRLPNQKLVLVLVVVTHPLYAVSHYISEPVERHLGFPRHLQLRQDVLQLVNFVYLRVQLQLQLKVLSSQLPYHVHLALQAEVADDVALAAYQ